MLTKWKMVFTMVCLSIWSSRFPFFLLLLLLLLIDWLLRHIDALVNIFSLFFLSLAFIECVLTDIANKQSFILNLIIEWEKEKKKLFSFQTDISKNVDAYIRENRITHTHTLWTYYAIFMAQCFLCMARLQMLQWTSPVFCSIKTDAFCEYFIFECLNDDFLFWMIPNEPNETKEKKGGRFRINATSVCCWSKRP